MIHKYCELFVNCCLFDFCSNQSMRCLIFWWDLTLNCIRSIYKWPVRLTCSVNFAVLKSVWFNSRKPSRLVHEFHDSFQSKFTPLFRMLKLNSSTNNYYGCCVHFESFLRLFVHLMFQIKSQIQDCWKPSMPIPLQMYDVLWQRNAKICCGWSIATAIPPRMIFLIPSPLIVFVNNSCLWCWHI